MAEKAKVEKVEKTITGLELNIEIILVYIFSILGFIFSFLVDKNTSKRAKFAYNQAGAVFICELVLGSIVIVPFIGVLGGTLATLIFVFAIVALIKGYQGEDYKIPGIYDLGQAIWGNKK